MNQTHDEDLSLLSAWRTGSNTAGNQLYRRHEPKLRRFFQSKVPAVEVDEMIQQTWLAVARIGRQEESEASLDRHPRIRDSFRAYLFGIARHVVLGWYRKHHGSQRFDPEVDSVEAMVPSISRQLSLQRKVKLLELAMQSLPIELQMLAEARYVEELTGPEIAEMFAIPEGTVRSRLSRARKLLDDALARLDGTASWHK